MMSSKESKVGPVCQATTLQAVNMGYEINGKKILSDVNATFEPRKLTAVMGKQQQVLSRGSHANILGPSGAGKTTMLNTLAMRSGGDRTGDVLVNGTADHPFTKCHTSSFRNAASAVEHAQAALLHAARRHTLPATNNSPSAVLRRHDANPRRQERERS